MKRSAAFSLIFFALVASCSEGNVIILPRPQPLPSFQINATELHEGNNCSFTVSMRTSCSSVPHTRDSISISFGDPYGNQVYVPRLDDPPRSNSNSNSRMFEPCSMDTFQIYGPCTYHICYVYLYRSGSDGWRPLDVTFTPFNPTTFFYDVFIPGDVWFGFNNCGCYDYDDGRSVI